MVYSVTNGKGLYFCKYDAYNIIITKKDELGYDMGDIATFESLTAAQEVATHLGWSVKKIED